MNGQAFPVVDISAFRAGEPGGDDAVSEVRQAATSLGFFAIVGHGVSRTALERMYGISAAFFDMPSVRKQKTAAVGVELGGLTYSPLETEALGASTGDTVPSDLKESLDFGPHFPGDDWPSEPTDLHAIWLEYFGVMGDLAGQLRRLFALAIGLAPDFFDRYFVDHASSLRVLRYPDQTSPPLEGQLRAGVHTDYGFLTILRTEDAPGGLQVQDLGGTWVDVPNIPDSFVVNIGDVLMRWTNDHWRSTPHRVVNPPRSATGTTQRQSIAYFHNPARDAVIDVLPEFINSDEPSRYESIEYGEYADLRYRHTHGTAKT